jgi:hypothetical protein
MFTAPVGNEETLHRGVVDTCQTIRNNMERILRYMMRHVEVCIESHGGHTINVHFQI